MQRLMIISGDCHAGGPPAAYREYLEPAHRERYDDAVAHPERMYQRAAHITGMDLPALRADSEADDSPLTSHWTTERRLAVLDTEGIVAEVLFPQPAGRAAPPFFNSFGHPSDPGEPGLVSAGCRAYNRWLADFCASSPQPERHAGLALIGDVGDVGAAVAEIEWAKGAGLRGVIIRSQPLSGYGWHDPRYEPIWAACESLALPVHTHGGEGLELGDLPGSLSIFFTECGWFAHRLFWMLLWSGIGNIVWGSDFPHYEGTWPKTEEALYETFNGVPEGELRAMLGENALQVYGFDREALAPHVARVGPSLEAFHA